MEKTVSKRTLRRQQKKTLIAEAEADIAKVELYIETNKKRLSNQDLKGLENLRELLYVHCQGLINSEV